MLSGARLSPLTMVTVAAAPAGATAGGDGLAAAAGDGRFAAALEHAQEAADEPARRARSTGPAARTLPDGHAHGPVRARVPGAPPRPATIGPDTTMLVQADGRPLAAERDQQPADETGAATAEASPLAAAAAPLHSPCLCTAAGEPARPASAAGPAEPSTRTGAAEAASGDGLSPLEHPARSTRSLDTRRPAHDAAADALAADHGSLASAPPAGPSRATAAAASAPPPAAEARGETVPTTAAATATAAAAEAGAQNAPGAELMAGGAPAAALEPALQPAFGTPAATPAATPVAGAGTEPARPGWHEGRLAAAVDTPQFAPALGAQLSVLVRDGVQQARLHLNPAEMGPIAVQISLEGTAARIEMAAEHALTRQLLEQAMPVLAGALRDSGMTLAGGGVFEQPRRPPEGGAPAHGQAPKGLGAQDGDAPAAGAMPARRLLGALDVYA